MAEILISVIIPIYYGKKYIVKQIRQLEQAAGRLSKETIEVLFVNDAPDEILDVNLHSDVIKIRVFNTDINRGIHGARVRGLSLAEGEYIHFLDQDDEISPNFYISQLNKIGDADLIYCRGYNGDRQIYNLDRVFETAMQRENMLDRPMLISPGQAVIRRSSIPELWKKDILNHQGADDCFLWLLMLAMNSKFVCNEALLFRHTLNGGNFSADILNLKESEEEMVRILLNNNLFMRGEANLLMKYPEKQFKRRYILLYRGNIVMRIMDTLLLCAEKDITPGLILKENGIKCIAIYGAGTLGKRLKGLLKRSDIDVKFFIDKNAEFIEYDLPVYKPELMPTNVDAILISMVSRENEVTEVLNQYYCGKILRIRDVANEMRERYETSAACWK